MLPAIMAGKAKASRGLTLMGAGGQFQTGFEQTVLAAFQKAHPDISVFYYPVGNSAQMLGLLRMQRMYPSTDVVLMDAGLAGWATGENLFVPMTAETMPVLKDLIPEASVPRVAGPALMLDSLAVGYNPSQVGQPPRSWRSLWDPAYGRRLGLQTPPDPAALALTAVAGRVFGGSELYQSLAVGITALTQLAPRVVVWDPVPDIYTAIALDDASIGPGWNAQAQQQAMLTPGRLAAAIPEDGTPVRLTTVNQVKGSPQPEAARTLIAWLLGVEAQRLLAESMCFAPVNARVSLAPAALARAGATPAMAQRRMMVDWVAINAMRDKITAAWRSGSLAAR